MTHCAFSVVAPDASAGDLELAVFVALCRLSLGERVTVPAVPDGAAVAVLHAAAVLFTSLPVPDATQAPVLEAAVIERAAAALGAALDALPADDPHAVAAEAWADLALGELAIVVADLRVAWHRFVAVTGRPVAIRIAAMLRLVELAAERRDLEAARGWARKATALAGAHDREVQAGRARLSCGLLDYAVGDLAAMRVSLAAVTGDGGVAAIARILLATAEPGARAMQLLADTLAEAITTDDPLIYALCVLVGARRYRVLGRTEDAALILAAGIEQLRNRAPHLANALIAEREPPVG